MRGIVIARILTGILFAFGSGTSFAVSLYNANAYQALTADTRSFRVGDALTILVIEASSAESSADSTVGRRTNVSVGATDATGQPYDLGLNLTRDGHGKGVTSRAGKLKAQISVRVQDVAANGDLVVKGSQKITVNGEVQTIMVSGVVRPVDVSADNVVLSSRLVNADIVYKGKGFVERSQSEGWLARLFSFLGF